MVDYNFIQVPTKLYLRLDNNCRVLLVALIRLSHKYNQETEGKGWFFCTNADLEAETKLSRQVINGALDALLSVGAVDFIPQEQGKGVKQTARNYMVNYDAFKRFDETPSKECIERPEYQIKTSDYKHGSFVWQGKEWAGKQASFAITSTETSAKPQPKVTTNIEVIETNSAL